VVLSGGIIACRALPELLLVSIFIAIVVLGYRAVRTSFVGVVVAALVQLRPLGIEEEQPIGDAAAQQLADFMGLQRQQDALTFLDKRLQSVALVLVLNLAEDWPDEIAYLVIDAFAATVAAVDETPPALVELQEDLPELLLQAAAGLAAPLLLLLVDSLAEVGEVAGPL